MTKIIILENEACTDNRLEVKLSNGQIFSVLVDNVTGKVRLLTNNPHAIGRVYVNEHGMPANGVPCEYYGYPSD
jgi:hypothetical protein